MGIGVYLVRREGEEHEEMYHQAFILLLSLSILGMSLALLGLPLLESWVRLTGFGPVALVLFLGLPMLVMAEVPLARLGRALEYKSVALIEVAGLSVYYAVALPLAFTGFGVAAPLAGWWVQQILTVTLLYYSAHYYPRFHWDFALVKEMISYGFGFSATTWIWQLRELVNPLVVGRFLGAEAVGYVALAIRFTKGLTFVKEAVWRISLAVLGRVQQDKSRLVRAVTEGMNLQIVASGPPLVAFALIAPWIILPLFGSAWQPVLLIYPFIALSFLTNAVFNLHSSALYTLGRSLGVGVFHLVHIVLFGGAALLLVPRLGLVGYGWAEVAALGSYAVIHSFFAREIGTLVYGMAIIRWAAFALALFVNQLGWWATLGLVIISLWPRTWRELGGYLAALRGSKGEEHP
jgi:PST family polysaccharide transporter